MAKSISIMKEKDVLHLLVDGEEIKDVVSYQLSESVNECPRLIIEVAVRGEINVLVDQ